MLSSRRRGGRGKVQPLYVFFSLARQVAAAYDFIPRQSKERALNKPPSACIKDSFTVGYLAQSW